MLIRKAKLKDVPELYNLINEYAKEGLRTMASFINLPKYLQGPYKSLDMRWLRIQDCL